MAQAKPRPLVYVADDEAPDSPQAITPARIAAAARRHRGAFSRVRVVHGPDAAALAEAEIVLGVAFDPATLRAAAPQLRWIQSLNAGVEKQAPKDRKSTRLNSSH